MIYKTLGKTGLEVSIIGFGASPLGGEFGAIDPEEGRRAVHYAIDQGINYFEHLQSPFDPIDEYGRIRRGFTNNKGTWIHQVIRSFPAKHGSVLDPVIEIFRK